MLPLNLEAQLPQNAKSEHKDLCSEAQSPFVSAEHPLFPHPHRLTFLCYQRIHFPFFQAPLGIQQAEALTRSDCLLWCFTSLTQAG